jgi:hypothetical protein
MWERILNALLHELENNPDRVLDIAETVITLAKSNPDATQAIVNVIKDKVKAK